MTFLVPKASRVRKVSLRDIRAEFQRIYTELNSMVGSVAGTNRNQISDIYVDATTSELVITHSGGEKRIT